MGLSLLFVLILLYGTVPTRSADIFPKIIEVEEKGGFILWVIATTDLEQCEIEYNGTKHSSEEVKPVVYDFGTIETVSKKNAQECGFRVRGVTKLGKAKWVIYYYLDGVNNRETAEVNVIPRRTSKCAQDDRCELVNPTTNEKKSCKEASVLNTDWEMRCLSYGSMQVKVDYAKGKISIDEESSDTTANEVAFVDVRQFEKVEDKGKVSAVLSCKSDKQSTCIVKHISSGRLFNIQSGLQSADKRYSTFKTVLASGRCQFEIVKPIQLEDIGLWKMYMSDKECSFIVRPAIDESVLVKTLKEKVTLSCAKFLNYPLTKCFLQSLVGNDSTMQFMTERELRRGVCEFVVDSADEREWFCGFNGPSSDQEDIIIKYTVKKYNNALVDEQVKVLADGTAMAEVYEINGAPMAHCLILNPKGNMSSLSSVDELNDEDLLYSGLGMDLAKGHCAMRFKDPIDIGTWRFDVEMEDGSNYHLDYETDYSNLLPDSGI